LLAALAKLADRVDQSDRAEQREQETGAVPAVEGVVGDQPGDQGAGDSHQHGFEQAHRIATGQQQPRRSPDQEPSDRQEDEIAENLHDRL
jgi:hypothetical protein